MTVGFGADMPTRPGDSDIARYSTDATLQVTGDLTANAAFSPSNFMRADLSYSVPSSIVAGLTFTKYDDKSRTNFAKQKHNLTLSATLPFTVAKRYFGLRAHVMVDKFAASDALTLNYGLNASVSRVYINYFGKVKRTKYVNYSSQNITSQALISTEFFRWLRPQFRIDYDHSANIFTRVGSSESGVRPIASPCAIVISGLIMTRSSDPSSSNIETMRLVSYLYGMRSTSTMPVLRRARPKLSM